MPTHKPLTIFYLIDGARPDVLKQLLDEGKLPNIQEHILSQGTFRTATTCFPSTTGPAYLPFLTGCLPGTQNIPGIRWFDKAEFKRTRFNKYAMRSYCGPEAAWFNTDMHADKPTLLESFDRSFNIFNMITRGVPEAHDLPKKIKSKLYINAHFRHIHHPVDVAAHEHLMKGLAMDPDFIFAVFPCIDWNSHVYHPHHEETIKSYQYMDYSVGEVAKHLKKTGQWKNTLLLMASDHGLTKTDKHLDLASFFRKRGFRTLEYPWIFTFRPQVAVMISGNSYGSVHFMPDNSGEILSGQKLLDFAGSSFHELIAEPAVDFVAYRGDENEFWVQNEQGKAKIVQHGKEFKHGKGLSYHPITADPFNLGEIATPLGYRASLATTFEADYPDALVQIAQLFGCRRAGDLVVSANEGYDLREFWEYPEHKGSHGSLQKAHIKVPLIYNQTGWNEQPARTCDVYNSILKFMGKPTKAYSDGTALF